MMNKASKKKRDIYINHYGGMNAVIKQDDENKF